jgi:hypothetical protein
MEKHSRKALFITSLLFTTITLADTQSITFGELIKNVTNSVNKTNQPNQAPVAVATSTPAPASSADLLNKMIVVKSSKAVGDSGLRVVASDGAIFTADIYTIGTIGYDMIVKAQKLKTPICLTEVTKNPEKKNSWFFEGAQAKCSN